MSEKKGFVYIAYHRHGILDCMELKDTIDKLVEWDQRDIVVDLTENIMISEGETAALARAVKNLCGTNRKLRLITGDHIRTKLKTTRLSDVGKVMAFETSDSLFCTHLFFDAPSLV
jgi:hypothetical protein